MKTTATQKQILAHLKNKASFGVCVCRRGKHIEGVRTMSAANALAAAGVLVETYCHSYVEYKNGKGIHVTEKSFRLA